MSTPGRSLLVRGGTVVNGRGSQRLDFLVESGRIAAIGTDLPRADQIVEAAGLIVMPGGVDTHVHLMDPGDTTREDFPSGTAAAAARGVTTIIEHTHGHPIRTADDLIAKRSHLSGRSNVDYALAAHAWPGYAEGLAELWSSGIAFFKIFTCTTHGVPALEGETLTTALGAMAAAGAPALIHCEDETITLEAERALRESGRTDNGILSEWRSREAELAAIAATASLVETTGVSATIAHVSSEAAASVVADAQRRGAALAAETCPQYLTLREDEVLTEGALRKFTPPARIRNDGEEATMWDLLRDGVFSHISTDHAPSTLAQKSEGSIWDVHFGLPGLDTTFPFLIDAAVSGRIGFEDVARLYSEHPADRYGLADRKGRIRVAADADFVLVDPAAEWVVFDTDVISKAGWSPYSGRTFRGGVVATYLRGAEIAAGGTPHRQLTGEFLTAGGVGQ